MSIDNSKFNTKSISLDCNRFTEEKPTDNTFDK